MGKIEIYTNRRVYEWKHNVNGPHKSCDCTTSPQIVSVLSDVVYRVHTSFGMVDPRTVTKPHQSVTDCMDCFVKNLVYGQEFPSYWRVLLHPLLVLPVKFSVGQGHVLCEWINKVYYWDTLVITSRVKYWLLRASRVCVDTPSVFLLTFRRLTFRTPEETGVGRL